MMNRDEHLAWCKRRALALLDAGDHVQAIHSMMNDMDRHPETRTNGTTIALYLAVCQEGTPEAARCFIEGFN